MARILTGYRHYSSIYMYLETKGAASFRLVVRKSVIDVMTQKMSSRLFTQIVNLCVFLLLTLFSSANMIILIYEYVKIIENTKQQWLLIQSHQYFLTKCCHSS